MGRFTLRQAQGERGLRRFTLRQAQGERGLRRFTLRQAQGERGLRRAALRTGSGRTGFCGARPFDKLRANGVCGARPFDRLRANGVLRRAAPSTGSGRTVGAFVGVQGDYAAGDYAGQVHALEALGGADVLPGRLARRLRARPSDMGMASNSRIMRRRVSLFMAGSGMAILLGWRLVAFVLVYHAQHGFSGHEPAQDFRRTGL